MQQSELPQSEYDLIVRFQRCSNYPRDENGVISLADGLRKAADTFGVEMVAIVDACAVISQYCPTDHDLLNVARGIRDERVREAESKRDQKAEWEKQYGKPKPFDWEAENRQIMVDARKHWERDAKLQEWLRNKARERHMTLAQMGQTDYMRLLMEGQKVFGIAETPEQRKLVNG